MATSAELKMHVLFSVICTIGLFIDLVSSQVRLTIPCDDSNRQCSALCTNCTEPFVCVLPDICACPAESIGADCLDPPQNVTVLVTGFSSLEISWEPPQQTGSGSGESTITDYIIFCDYSMFRTIFSVDPADNLSSELSSLTPHTTYTCCVIANTTRGPSSLACDTQTTLESVPADAPVNVTVTALCSTIIEVEWSPPRTPNGIIVHYTLVINDFGMNVTASSGHQRVVIDVSQLTVFEFYAVFLSASTSVGAGPTSVNVIAVPDEPCAMIEFNTTLFVLNESDNPVLVCVEFHGHPELSNSTTISFILRPMDITTDENDYIIDSNLMNEVGIADFPFCFNVIPSMDSLLETNETFRLYLENIDDDGVINTTSAIFTIIDSTQPTVATVELTVTEIRDIVAESDRTESDLEIIAGSLEGVVDAVFTDIPISEEVLGTLIESISNLSVSWDTQVLQTSISQDIVMSLEQIAIASTAASENVNITTNTNDLVTQITKANIANVSDDVRFSPRDGDASITLPLSLFENEVTVFFALYLSDVLFPFESNESNIAISTPVIGANIPDNLQTENLSENVTVTFQLQNRTSMVDCVSYDIITNGWVPDGCVTMLYDNGTVFCSCDHLENFAALTNTSTPNACDHAGNFVCTCNVGFRLGSDGTTCHEILMADTPQISLTPDVTTVIVEPGRHFSIVCESGGDFRGEVEWSRLIGSENQMIPNGMGIEANCDLEGMLYRAEDGSFSEVLTSGRLGIRIAAAGFYECTADNTIEVNADRVKVIVPELRSEHRLAETYIRFSVSEVESLNPCINTPVTTFLNYVALSSYDEAAEGAQDFNCEIVPSVDENDRVECVFQNYNNSASFTTDDMRNLLTQLVKNEIPMIVNSFVISDDGFCDSNTNDDGDGYGEYEWSESSVGTVELRPCVYSGFGENPMARRECLEKGSWSDVMYDECFTLITSMYQDISLTNTTASNVVEVVTDLEELVGNTISSLDQSQMNFDVITNVVDISRQIVDEADLDNEEIVEIVQDVVAIVDSVLIWPAEEVEQSGSFLVETYEALASTLAQRNDSNTTEGVIINESGQNSAIIIEQAKIENLVDRGRDFSAFVGNGVVVGSTASNNRTLEDPIASIQLPPEVFQGLRRDMDPGLVFTAYINSVLFPVSNSNGTMEIRSPVIGALVAGQDPPQNLSTPVQVVFLLEPENDDEVFMDAECVSWDFRRADWINQGCVTEFSPGSCDAVCNCSHLTNFAVLVDICSRTNDDCRLNAGNKKALDSISIVGITLSIIGLLLTIFTMIYFKKLRQRDVSIFHAQLSVAMLGMLLVFVTGIDQTGGLGGCVFASLLIHYFTLCSVMWMGGESLLMFQKLVRVFAQTTKRQIVVISLICWLVPIILVVVPVAADPHNLVSSVDVLQPEQTCGANSTTRSDIQYCFIGDSSVFFGAFLTPILTVFAFNGVIFVVIIKVLIQHAYFKHKSTNTQKRNSLKTAKHMTISIFAIMTLFGLTWIFGAFTISRDTVFFQYLFNIFNTVQGFMIFIFFCVVPKDTRELWIRFLFHRCEKVQEKLLSTSTTPQAKGRDKAMGPFGGLDSILKKRNTESDEMSLNHISDSSASHDQRLSRETISEVEDSSEVETEKNSKETKVKPKSTKTHDQSSGKKTFGDVIVNPGALEPIVENDKEVKEHEGDDLTDLRDKTSQVQVDLRDKKPQFVQVEESTPTKEGARNDHADVVFENKNTIPSLYPDLSLLDVDDD